MVKVDELVIKIKNDCDLKDNVFIHGISLEKYGSLDIARSIISSGLNSGYFTMFRTVRDLGKVNELESNELRYSFLSRGMDKALNVLVVIPDFLKLGNSYLPIFPQDLINKTNNKNDGDYRTLLDILLFSIKDGKMVIPKEFIYGYYEIDLKTNEVVFVENDKYIFNLNNDEYEEFYHELESKLKSAGYGFLLDLGENRDKKTLEIALKKSNNMALFDNGISKIVVEKMQQQFNIERSVRK